MQPIKGVSFFGPNCDYVISDCGHVFIWRKKDGQLLRAMQADIRSVDCVEQHPTEIVIASSGLETDVKIWAPGDSENPSTYNYDVRPFFYSNIAYYTWIVMFLFYYYFCYDDYFHTLVTQIVKFDVTC
jgi:WD repeat-containing protein 42A